MPNIRFVRESVVHHFLRVRCRFVNGEEEVRILRWEVLVAQKINRRELVLSMILATLRVGLVPRFTMV